MSKVASVEKIHSIEIHPNADSLLKAKVLGWPVVIKKDAGYKDGDLVVFIFIDTIVDKDNPFFAFMEKQKWRTWNARFRGEPSSGLVCPLQIALDKGLKVEDLVEGLEIGAAINCVHYEKPIAPELAGQVKSNFPSNYISVTDEDNALSYPKVMNEFRGLSCYLTVKMDGSSFTVLRNNEEEHVCSRRLSLIEGDSVFWRMEKKYKILEKLRNLKVNAAFQGEICGPKINGNRLEMTEPDLFIFNAVNLDTKDFFGFYTLKSLCTQLELKMVPTIENFRFDETWDLERLRKIANELKYPNGKPGEGIVLRPCLPRWSDTLGGPLSVKIINQNYKE